MRFHPYRLSIHPARRDPGRFALQAVLALALAASWGCAVRAQKAETAVEPAARPGAAEAASPAQEAGESEIDKPGPPLAEGAATQGRDAATLKRLLVLSAIRKHKAQGGDYKLGAGDVLKIAVFDLPEMSRTVKISDTGAISLPLVGSVGAAGLSAEDLRGRLEKLLGASYLVNPQVDVFVETYGSQRVAVIGRVEKPGTYPLSQMNNRILDLIGQAGGLSPQAARRVELFPVEENPAGPSAPLFAAAALDPGEAGAGPEGVVSSALGGAGALGRPHGLQPIVVSIYDLMNPADPVAGLSLRDGDILFVPDQGEFFVGGEVRRPGKFALSERSGILSAIAEAGGLGEYPEADEVILVRVLPSGEKKMTEVDYEEIANGEQPDIALQAGDQIIVPRDRLKATFFTVIDTMGRFIGIGVSAPL